MTDRRFMVPTCLLRLEWPPNDGLKPGDAQFDAMLNSVRREGIHEPLTIKRDWSLIDGAHRLCAARLLGLEWVPVRVWTGVEFIPEALAAPPTEPRA